VLQLGRGAAERNAAGLEHVRPRAQLQGQARVLFDEQHRHAAGAIQPRQVLGKVVDDHGRQAQRQLVDGQHIRLRHERPADRHHLLLAAGQGPGDPPTHLGQRREQLEHGARVAGPTCPRAQPQVVLDGHVGKQLSALGHLRDAARQAVPATGRLEQAAHRVEQRGLARSVGTDQRHHLATVDLEAHAVEGGRLPVAHDQVVDLKHARHADAPGRGRRR
jgi:hypothetical protein